MEIYANDELKRQRSWYEHTDGHFLEQRPAYPWESLEFFDRQWKHQYKSKPDTN